MKLRPYQEKHQLRTWDKQVPSKRDVLLILMKTLELLSEALPVALEYIGTKPHAVQLEFWRSFTSFDRHTDLTFIANGKSYPDDELLAYNAVLEDWRQLVECRVDIPTGELKESL